MTAREQLALAVLDPLEEAKCIAALRALQGADSEPLYSADQVCARLGVSKSTFKRMRVPPSWRSGQVLRWTWTDVAAAGRRAGKRTTEGGKAA
ncbi:MAG: hypothetical protein KJ579_02470 [Verrucomicrobia bacterium]|nr:hypothetical protein [Verrucomicrobiota bacterium]